ncbi:hypothetical protein I302_102985 [Kwoniella bestiolae CBS 10118]|uniref:RING-type domain-containing protein n=1 Tax=Kwoniella bestiolae CBS 10118 TaxID=1296100 RepID=A0A1B9GGH3_9TREE|nr:hypothetical protein I302_01681 [Kwoniella bestiolae CBS 10118]OCF30162.1 hypothetical protein I302_01681 [Kwoniella bestiolae CBS 10118]
MNTGRTSAATAATGRRRDEAGGSRGNTPAGGARAKPRKKPKPSPSPSPSPRTGPIPTPYLALAPTPISSLSASTIDHLAATAAASSSNLVLPSAYVRSSQERRNRSTPNLNNTSEPNEGEAGAGPSIRPGTSRQQKYVTSLLSPPTIIPGGTSSAPRIQNTQPPPNTRRRSGERERLNTRRSQERLRELVVGNPSLTSLGQLGQILESGQLPEEEEQENGLAQAQQDAQNNAQRRRRRIVRGETGEGGMRRRLTVSSREEGRALGLARGASMRRTNVWDDIPEAGEPPPPFPFPTPSTARLPPAFGTAPTTSQSEERPRSPPPSFEIAIGLSPAPSPALPSTTSTPSTPRASRPGLTVITNIPQVIVLNTPEESPSSTHYASAPSSPTHTVIGFDNIRASERARREERDDRKAWNEDLLAGYTLEERVRREIERRREREPSREYAQEEGTGQEGSETESVGSIDGEEIVAEPGPGDTLSPAETPEDTSTVAQTEPSTEVEDSTKAEPAASIGILAPNSSVTSNEQSSTPDIETPPAIEDRASPMSQPDRTPDQPSLEPVSHLTSITDQPEDSPVPSQAPEVAIDHGPAAMQANEDDSTSHSVISEVNPIPSDITAETPLKSSLESITPPASQPPPESPQLKHDGFSEAMKANVTPKRRKPTRSSTVDTEISPNTSSSLHVKRLSVPEFSPFRPQLHKAFSNEPLFSKHGWDGSPELEAPAQLGSMIGVKAKDAKQDNITHQPNDVSTPKEVLPPSREAAMKRRNLESKSPKPVSSFPAPLSLPKPQTKVKMIEQKPISGPLINFDSPSSSPPHSALDVPPLTNRERATSTSTSTDISALAASSAELLSLLELQDEILVDSEPIAESSAQGAARMARKPPPPPPPPPKRQEPIRRVPPPLPKTQASPVHSKKQEHDDEGSIKSLKVDNAPPPSLPRRPPPPPPPRLNLIPKMPPPLPPRPTPNRAPSSASTPLTLSASADSDDTIKASSPIIPPRLNLTGVGNAQGHNKPKGPRPRPPPPRARQTNWFKGFSPFKSSAPATSQEEPTIIPSTPEVAPHARPSNERAQTDFPHLVPPATEQAQEEERERVIERSSSAMNLGTSSPSTSESPARSPERQATLPLTDVGQSAEDPTSPSEERREWTDLDLLVSRIQDLPPDQRGVYEGYTQISQFLGPSKSQAASPAALANLLPGLITVDSRRTTPQGKVKLKLSLLGMRVTKCGICLSQFKSGEKGVMLPMCSHVGHESCARRWFRERGTCWVCRTVLPEE